MTWTRLSEDFMDRPEIYRLSRSARLLHVEALVWCNKRGTDGHIDAGAVRRITDAPDWQALATELEASGAWSPDGDDAWTLDWSEQEDAADVRTRRDARAETQKRYRQRQAAHQRGDHSLCDPRYCPAGVTGNATSHATSHDTGHKTTPRPVPSRPEGEGQGQGAGTGSADAPPGRAPANQHDTDTDWDAAIETATGHRYRPDQDGRCTFIQKTRVIDPTVCGYRAEDWRHGHKPEGDACPCGHPSHHPVHYAGEQATS
ncbi:hypothetical protein [Nocardioides nanhaiensis]|uniref:Uncharacterized protein n=1 Tax=Nocardioides nanhaiensis TaxID=1476871 RepID=A0ABP8X0Z7_9ACTN